MREEKATTPDTTTTEDTTEEEAFTRRFAKSAALARTLQRELRELHKGAYYWNENILGVLPEVYVMSLLIENDRRKRPPLTPTQIEEMEKIPRRSATRYLNQLVKQGLATRKAKGYVTKPAHYKATINAPYIKRTTAVIKSGAHVLRKLMK